MSMALDACSVINLGKVDALEVALSSVREDFWIGPTAVLECGPQLAAELLRLNNIGLLSFVPDHMISTPRVLELASEHDIGDGEIETIAVCEAAGWSICSDDRPARDLATELIGAQKVVGSLRLLRWCVEDGSLACDDVFDRYEQMKHLGAFLPVLEQDFFCANVGDC